MKLIKNLFFLTILLTLSACGVAEDILDDDSGGGGSAASSCGSMNEESCAMFKAVNSYRLSQGKAALTINNTCVKFAQDHAVDMVVRNFFSHHSPTETFQQRASRYGLSYAGENIAMGSQDVPTILSMWQNSPGHNSNMLNGMYRSTGLGYYQGRWVQCFSGYSE